MYFRCPCGRHIARKKFISRGIDRGRINGNPEKKIMNGSSVDDVQ